MVMSSERPKIIDGYPASLALSLGLTNRNLQELGGYNTDRFPRDILAGKVPMPKYLNDAICELQIDVDVMADQMIEQVLGGSTLIYVFKTNADLREHFTYWPARGQSEGGFVGPHRIAALSACESLLKDYSIETDLIFFNANQ